MTATGRPGDHDERRPQIIRDAACPAAGGDAPFQAWGAQSVPYSLKVHCSGSMLMMTTPAVDERSADGILGCAPAGRTVCLVTPRRLYQSNPGGLPRPPAHCPSLVPVLILTQPVGLALEADPKELMLYRQAVPTALPEARTRSMHDDSHHRLGG